jgi:predicted lipoprotein
MESPGLKARGSKDTDGGSVRAVFVKGTAKIAEVDRKSRVGLARLALPWATDRQAAIQIGPVIRGTALRDALDFIRFTDFINQLEFASVAGALNDRVVIQVLQDQSSIVAGADVTFVGAVPTSAAAQTLEIVPVKLSVGNVGAGFSRPASGGLKPAPTQAGRASR